MACCKERDHVFICVYFAAAAAAMGFLPGMIVKVPALMYRCFVCTAIDDVGWLSRAGTRRLVTAALLKAGVPAMSLQPAASAVCRGGKLVSLATAPIKVLYNLRAA